MTVSGKYVIIAILSVALIAAGTSWWFRYNATHRAVEFWGPSVARLIRDAKVVELYHFEGADAPDSNLNNELHDREVLAFLDRPNNRLDISSARGLTHLRNALLEDRSYSWPARRTTPQDRWKWILLFRNASGGYVVLVISPDFQIIAQAGIRERTSGVGPFKRFEVLTPMVVSCEPIAGGLREMIEELMPDTSENSAVESAAPSANR